jgi:DNA-binding response OmpR family regulator
MKKKKILIDDDPDICVHTLREILMDNGFAADSFTEPCSALNRFEVGLYDLLLLDVKMSEMNGFQLYHEMKKIDEKAKACFLTAADVRYGAFSEEKVFFALDRELFLQKPIESTKLILEVMFLNDRCLTNSNRFHVSFAFSYLYLGLKQAEVVILGSANCNICIQAATVLIL